VKLLFRVLALMVAATWTVNLQAQNAPSTAAPKTPKAGVPATPKTAEAAAEAPPETVVITLSGICPAKPAKPASPAKPAECKIAVTRAQFDKVYAAVTAGPQPRPMDKRLLATRYAQLLYAATLAENENLASSPEVQERLRLARLQVLQQELMRELQEKSQPSPAELEQYYKANSKRFLELKVDRIWVPLRTKDNSKPDEAALKELAENLRQQAVSGADPKTLQAEAYEKAGLQNPPDPKLVLRQERVPPAEQVILQLKPGEVSEVVKEPAGFYIFKLEEQRTIPLNEAMPEIQRTLGPDKLKQATDELARKATPDLNTQYFGAAPAPAATPVTPRPLTPGTPPVSPAGAAPVAAPKPPGPVAPPVMAPSPQPPSK